MTNNPSSDPACLIEEQLSQTTPHLPRDLLTLLMNTLISAESHSFCGAAFETISPDRANCRNGYRGREFDARAGTLELTVPKLPAGTYLPEGLLKRRKRAERALTSVIATRYLLGVSAHRMDKLVQSPGITGLRMSQVLEMAKGQIA